MCEEIAEQIKEEQLDVSAEADCPGNSSCDKGKRLLMKEWLQYLLNTNKLPDILQWVNKDNGLFRIKWLHKATDNWSLSSDAVLFKEWCMHTGKYDPKQENPRRWKANFRCALNSLPDVVVVKDLCVKKGKDAYRVFKILPEKRPEKVKEKQEQARKRRKLDMPRKSAGGDVVTETDAGGESRAASGSVGSSDNDYESSSDDTFDEENGATAATSEATIKSERLSDNFNGIDALFEAAFLMGDMASAAASQSVVAPPASAGNICHPAMPVSSYHGDIVSYYHQAVGVSGAPLLSAELQLTGVVSKKHVLAGVAEVAPNNLVTPPPPRVIDKTPSRLAVTPFSAVGGSVVFPSPAALPGLTSVDSSCTLAPQRMLSEFNQNLLLRASARVGGPTAVAAGRASLVTTQGTLMPVHVATSHSSCSLPAYLIPASLSFAGSASIVRHTPNGGNAKQPQQILPIRLTAAGTVSRLPMACISLTTSGPSLSSDIRAHSPGVHHVIHTGPWRQPAPITSVIGPSFFSAQSVAQLPVATVADAFWTARQAHPSLSSGVSTSTVSSEKRATAFLSLPDLAKPAINASYSQLRADVFNTDWTQLNFLAVSTSQRTRLVRLLDDDTARVVIDVCVTIGNDFTASVVAADEEIGNEHELWHGMPKIYSSAADVMTLVRRLSTVSSCTGIGGEAAELELLPASSELPTVARKRKRRTFVLRSSSCALLVTSGSDRCCRSCRLLQTCTSCGPSAENSPAGDGGGHGASLGLEGMTREELMGRVQLVEAQLAESRRTEGSGVKCS